MNGNEALERYRRQLIDWEAVQQDPKLANRLYRANHTTYKELRGTQEGRAGIESLTRDPVAAVRLMAAVHCLRWASEIGVPVLEEIMRMDREHSVTAKYTLVAYRAGELNLDW